MTAKPIAPTSAEISAELTDFAASYQNSQFIADEVCPILLVTRESDSYPKRLRIDQASIEDDYVGPRGRIPEVTYGVDEGTYRVKGRGKKAAVSEALELAADPSLNVRQAATQRAMQSVKLGREKRVADLIMTASNWASSNTGAVSNPWTDVTSGTPVDDMQTALEAIPFNGDDVTIWGVCSDQVLHTLQRHPQIKDLRGGGSTVDGLMDADAIARGVGFDRLFVSKIHRNTAAPGLTASYSRIWDSTKFAFVVVPKGMPSTEATLFACTFRFTLPGAVNGVRVREWNEPAEGLGGTDYVACELKDDEGVVQDDAGYLLTGVRS